MVDFRINWTLCTGKVRKPRLPGNGKIRAITPVGAVSPRTASAQLETAPTKHGERKCLSVFRIHYNSSTVTEIRHKKLLGGNQVLFRKKETERIAQAGWLKIDYRGPDIFVQLSGKLDRTLRNQIRPTLETLLQRNIDGAICLRMNDVFFLDTASAAGLIGFLREADWSNVRVEIWGASPIVMRVFEGLDASELLNRP